MPRSISPDLDVIGEGSFVLAFRAALMEPSRIPDLESLLSQGAELLAQPIERE